MHSMGLVASRERALSSGFARAAGWGVPAARGPAPPPARGAIRSAPIIVQVISIRDVLAM